MRMPQVSERIKEAPAQALRGVFAGIGQLLLITDKIRHKTPAHASVPQARAAQPTTTAPEAAAPPEEAAAPSEAAASPEVAAPPEEAVVVVEEAEVVVVEAVQAPEPAAEAEPTVSAEAVAVGAAALLPNYDALTVASLRARLRNLSIEQVRELAEYERAHAARPEVITMFERRVAKLEAGA